MKGSEFYERNITERRARYIEKLTTYTHKAEGVCVSRGRGQGFCVSRGRVFAGFCHEVQIKGYIPRDC